MAEVVAALVLVTMLDACSPYRLTASVTGFRNSISTAQASLDDGLTNYRADMASSRVAKLEFAHARVQTSKGCGFSSAADKNGNLNPPCMLIATNEVEPTVPRVIQGAASAKNKMSVLLRYADALQAISNAADSQTISSATDQLAGAASSLVVAAAPAGPQAGVAAATTGAVIAAAIETAGTTARIGLDAQRLEVLRRTVARTDPHIKTISTGLGAYFDTLRLGRMDQLFAEANLRAERVGTAANDWRAGYDQAQQKLNVYNTLRDASGTEVGEAIAKAHAKLVDAANDTSTGPAEFAAAVGELSGRGQ